MVTDMVTTGMVTMGSRGCRSATEPGLMESGAYRHARLPGNRTASPALCG